MRSLFAEKRSLILWIVLIISSFAWFGFCFHDFSQALLNHTYTPDFPWLLNTGRYMLSHHRLPQHDIFSWTLSEHPWLLYQWLFEVLIAWIYQLIGEQAFIHSFIVLVALLYFVFPIVFGMSRRVPVLFSSVIAALVLPAIVINISLRPMIVTSFFLAIQYGLLTYYQKKPYPKWVLYITIAILYILWGNMHTGVSLGLLSLVLMGLGAWLEKRRVYSFEPPEFAEATNMPIRLYFYLAFTGLIDSMVNPYGISIYPYLANLSGENYLNTVIVELQSPNFHLQPYFFFTGLLIVFICLLPKTKRLFSCSECLHLIVFLFATLFVQRFVVWSCLFFVLILPKALFRGYQLFIQERFPSISKAITHYDKIFPVILSAFTFSAILFIFSPQIFQLPPALQGKCERLSKGLQAYTDLRTPKDRLFNDAVVGSCMIASIPDEKVFIDTRFDFYGEDFLKHQRLALFLQPHWQDYLAQWQVNTFVISKQWPLTRLMLEMPEYQKLYEDADVAILRKK